VSAPATKPTSTVRLEARRSLVVEAANSQNGRRITIHVDGEAVASLTCEEFRELVRLCQEVEQ